MNPTDKAPWEVALAQALEEDLERELQEFEASLPAPAHMSASELDKHAKEFFDQLGAMRSDPASEVKTTTTTESTPNEQSVRRIGLADARQLVEETARRVVGLLAPDELELLDWYLPHFWRHGVPSAGAAGGVGIGFTNETVGGDMISPWALALSREFVSILEARAEGGREALVHLPNERVSLHEQLLARSTDVVQGALGDKTDARLQALVNSIVDVVLYPDQL